MPIIIPDTLVGPTNTTDEIVVHRAGRSWAYKTSDFANEIKARNTTSILPQASNGAAFVSAQASGPTLAADTLLLSSGERIESGQVRWPAHGLVVGADYYLSQTAAGGYVTPAPVTGLVQKLFYVQDANNIFVDIGEMAYPDRAPLQHRWSSQAISKVSIANEFRWVGFYHVMTTGTNTTEPSGHFRIDMPADGFAVPVSDGTTRAVVPAVAGSSVDTGGIPLNNWDSLWYRHVSGTGSTSVPGNFLIVPYLSNTNATGPFTNPNEWVRIVSRASNGVYQLGNGDTMTPGMQIGSGVGVTVANWTAMKQRVMGDGYYFSPGGNTTTPIAFGFTGTIRWIDGGSTNGVNNLGYRDISITQKVAGTAIRGVNGAANRAWRLMTPAEKPEWFGGALRGNNPIVIASTTVVDLNDNETLYFVPNLDGASASEGQWVVAGYAGVVTTPVHWLPIASKQSTGGHATIQVLIGGVQYALRAGDATYTTTPADHFKDAKHRKITHKGLKYCRWTQSTFFAGTGANGLSATGAQGLLVSWDDNTLMYGISDGYVSWGNQYSYINVPAIGTQIPMVTPGSNITRVVQDISGRKYVPLANWEALYWIPPAYIGGNTSVNGDFVIGNYANGNACIPNNAIMVAKVEGALSFPAGTTASKTRVIFADGTYMQPGSSIVTGTPVQNDHAQGSGDWRPFVYPGQTGPGMTAAMPAVAGVGGAYSAPYTAFFRYLPLNDDPRGNIQLRGLILLTGNLPTNGRLAFLPGVQVIGNPILQVMTMATTLSDNKPIPSQVRFNNITVNGSTGVEIIAYADNFNNGNPYRTLGPNGNSSPAGTLQWASFDNIILPHA